MVRQIPMRKWNMYWNNSAQHNRYRQLRAVQTPFKAGTKQLSIFKEWRWMKRWFMFSEASPELVVNCHQLRARLVFISIYQY